MRLAEVLIRKKFVDYKIDELQKFICKVVQYDKTSQPELSSLRKELDLYIEQSQKYALQIVSANTQIEIVVGNTKISLDRVVRLRKTLERKIKNISDLITNSNGNLDIMSFINQRDNIYDEFLILDTAIRVMEWSADLD